MAAHDIGNLGPREPIDLKSSSIKEYVSFRDIGAFLHRHLQVFVICTAVSVGLGAIYSTTKTPVYSSTTRLVMDPEQGRIESQDSFSGTIIIEAAEIASQVEIVKSEAIARSVIKTLNLDKDPELTSGSSWQSVIRDQFRMFASWFAPAPKSETVAASSHEDATRRTMAAFLSRVSVIRVGQSYILEIGYSSTDAEKAARVANAIADAYVRTGLSERAAAAESGAKWLETRLIEVGGQAQDAAMAVEEFRAKNGIMDIGKQSSLDQQELSEISSQALAARAETAAESAKLDTLNRLMSGQTTDGNVAETINNARIQKLQEDIGVATVKLNDLTSRYETGNPAITNAQNDIARLKGEMRNEFARIQGVYRSNLEVAQTREKLLSEQLAALTSTGTDKNLARVDLTELESRATTYRRMYESILQQLIGTLQKQSFPLGNARVVTAATPPLAKTWPKTSIVIPFAALLGIAAALFIALMRDGMDRRVNSKGRLRRELGIASLGDVPVCGNRSFMSAYAGRSSLAASSALLPLRFVLDMPYSRFSEALRSVKSSVDSSFPPRSSIVVGITSVGAGEGKTTIATNLAQLYRNEGTSVVLVDADFLSAQLSRVATDSGEDFGMEPLQLHAASLKYMGSSEGFGTVVEHRAGHFGGEMPSSGAVPVLTITETEKLVLPTQRYGHLPALRSEIELLRKSYDVVMVDMSAFEDSADTRAICSYLDGVVVVVGRSRKMTIDRLSNALASFGSGKIRLLGVVNNCSDEGDRKAQGKGARRTPPTSSPWSSLTNRIDDKPGAPPLRLVVGIASTGRREILSAVLPHISKQTRLPDEVIVCVASPEDIDPRCLSGLDFPIRVLTSKRGSCSQRNHILDDIEGADVVLFLDDDFLMAPTYIEETESLFRGHRDIIMATGTVLADGITGPGISVQDGMKLVEAKGRRKSELAAMFKPIYNAYGCNMAIRLSAIIAGNVRFDENLPAYGWLEDVDFSRILARYGEVVCGKQMEGVHLGAKMGRTPGVRFGYSQIANPIYLMRKRTMSIRYAGVQIVRNLAANLVKVWKPEPWVDRKGRLRGNALACLDLLTGRLAPANVEALD
ncbi:Wzz/FepE/Etk N-terminal domain-containing protein [Rhizobium tubonense]|nr:Wzz/FepE/Etk N-terminal domain-containing protein [Rhizobium tubonense]